MLNAILCLFACQLAGELIRAALHLPVPGPVIGMFLLAGGLACRGANRAAVPAALGQTAEALINLMGLLFVPAGVGVIAEADLLRQEWRPIVAAVIGSTVLSTAVTGMVMHRVMLAARVRVWRRRLGRGRLARDLRGLSHG